MELLCKLIDKPFSTAIVMISTIIFVYYVTKLIPNPIDKIIELVKTLKKEIDFTQVKDWVEIINLLSIVIMGIVVILQLLVFCSSSIFTQVFSKNSLTSFPTTLTLSLIFLFIVTLYSPALILYSKKDEIMKEEAGKLLK